MLTKLITTKTLPVYDFNKSPNTAEPITHVVLTVDTSAIADSLQHAWLQENTNGSLINAGYFDVNGRAHHNDRFNATHKSRSMCVAVGAPRYSRRRDDAAPYDYRVSSFKIQKVKPSKKIQLSKKPAPIKVLKPKFPVHRVEQTPSLTEKIVHLFLKMAA